MISDNREQIVSLETAAGMLGVHKETLRRWDRKSILKAIRLGPRKDRKYKKEDLLKFLNSK